MKINKEILLDIPHRQASSKEGVMFYKYNDSGFKERWFKLYANLLFIYPSPPNLNESPSYVFLMENFIVNSHPETPNKFTIYFLSDPQIKYCFFCLNSRNTSEWLELFQNLSYRKLRLHLNSLRTQLKQLTGIDPLESTPWVHKL